MPETPEYINIKKPLVVKGDSKYREKEVDLNDPTTYLKEEYAKRHAQVQEKLGERGATDTEKRLAALNVELIEGYTQIYAEKSQAELEGILSNEASKPWEKAAARNVLHEMMRNNDVKLDEVAQRKWHTGKEDEEELG